jgi:thioredoxin-related protein
MDAWLTTYRRAALTLLLAVLPVVPASAQGLDWQPFETALAVADSTGHPVLVDVYAPWCGWCRKMKRDTYPELLGAESDRRFVLTRLNRDDNQTTHHYRGQRLTSMRLAHTLRAEGVPAVIFLAPDGEPLLYLSGFLRAETLRPVLDYIGSGAYRTQSFEAFRAQGAP